MMTLFVAVGGLLGVLARFGIGPVQAVLEVDAGEPGRAFGYVASSVVGGLLAATASHALGRKLA